MRGLLSIALVLFPVLGAAQDTAEQRLQELVPERRIAITRNIDFYGSDLANIFDTTLEACQRACLADRNCRAFTFNERSNACFPKSNVSERVEFEGAVSGQVFDTEVRVLAQALSRADELDFLTKGDFEAAHALARDLAQLHSTGKYSLEVMLRAAADRRSKGNVLDAMRWTGSALTLSDQPDLWIDYSVGLMAAADASSTQRSRHRSRAVAAAVNGYLRANGDAQRVLALSALSKALEATRRGRTMIPGLRLSLDIAQRDETEIALDRAISLYGFRVEDSAVDSNSATPRICAEFNETLVQSGLDYSTYVRLPDSGLTVEVNGAQLCIDGVQHGERYRITYRAGLPAQSGEFLTKDVEQTTYVRDRDPSIAFSGRAYVLPKVGQAAIPIETVNVGEVDLILRRVSDRSMVRVIEEDLFGVPLRGWQEQQMRNELAEEVWRGTGAVQSDLNRNMITRLPLDQAIAGQPAGIYTLRASLRGVDTDDVAPVTQWFVLSDLGISTLLGTDGLHVVLRGLGDAQAKVGVEVQLLSRANSVLAVATSDDQGRVLFDTGFTRGRGASAPAMVVARDGETDLAFLSLTDPAFDLSDRGVEGNPAAPPMDVFLTTDRGAYRAGETVHATALVRDVQAKALGDVPLTAILFRPDGVEYSRHLSASGRAGGHVFAMPIGSTAPRGSWRVEMRVDVDAPALASDTVLVEDFVPERIDFDLSLPEKIMLGDAPALSVDARYLFGPPAGDLPIEGEAVLSAAKGLEEWPSYRFGLHDERFNAVSSVLPPDQRTAADGRAVVNINLPDVDSVDRPLNLTVMARLAEGSGRPVERRVTTSILPERAMIGIKPAIDDVVPQGAQARFSLIGVGTDLTAEPMQVRWTINRVQTRYQWYRLYGNWNWEPTTTRTRVATGEATLGDVATEVGAIVDWGRYEIKVERLGGDYVSSSMGFYSGWYAPADASSTPDVLEVSLDQEAYASGDTATLRVVPRYAGTALVTVMSGHVIAMETVEVTEGENLIPLSVTDEWGVGAYVSATVLRPIDVEASRNPARALGLTYANIDPAEHALSVSIDAPDVAMPRSVLEVAVNVQGLVVGETGYVTLAAVDLGILNLTGFASPDPSDHYFGQRKLGVELRDIYGRLIDGMNGAAGQVRSGGDALGEAGLQSPPPTEELVAYFTGPVTVGPDGRAVAKFDMPSFNGTVRLMAVAWSDTGVGEAEHDVIVRDPVVVTASLPRFLAPGDNSRLLLDFVHTEGPTGQFPLTVYSKNTNVVTVSGTADSIDLAANGKATLALPLLAQSTGLAEIVVSLTLPDGRVLEKPLMISVRANDPEITRTSRFEVAAGGTFTYDSDVFAGFQPGSGSSTIAVGPLARFDAPGLLNALDRYPYGCTEQLTSRAMPLLYFDQVATAMGQGSDTEIADRIDQAIVKILGNQAANGGFGLWRPGSGDLWLDAYVGDFLSRAKAQGHAVPELAFRMTMDRLRNRVNVASDFEQGGQALAYALMVLAREGAANTADLRYYVDVKGDAFSTPLGAAQLGAALAFYGDQIRADAMFRRSAAMLGSNFGKPDTQVWRVDYGTRTRDAAAVLTLAIEAGTQVIVRDVLARRISQPFAQYSTQEAAWSLMAANALIGDMAGGEFAINGEPVNGPLVRVLAAQANAAPLMIENRGTGPSEVTLTTYGVPTEPVSRGGNGYLIEREYYTLQGQRIEPTDATVGTRFVTVIRVSPFDRIEARLMVSDPLPAGFEIDNPNLLRGGDIRALDWLDPATTRMAEFRDDRFLAAVDWRSDQPFHLAYIVRAVSPGSFHHPAASVEDMYRPQYRARTGASAVSIRE
jgi:uncharacterized protein YfaS (alpha-2-macroglobulin family)